MSKMMTSDSVPTLEQLNIHLTELPESRNCYNFFMGEFMLEYKLLQVLLIARLH
jgi:hypothetical protein